MLHGSGYKVSVTAHWVKQLKLYSTFTKEGFPGGSDGKESVCNAGDLVRSLGWEDPLEKELATHSSILAWTEVPGRATVHGVGVAKSQTQLSN